MEVLFIVALLLLGNLSGSWVWCNPDQVGASSELKQIEFDLDGVTSEDYVIKRGCERKAGHLFTPKPGRVIVSVKIKDRCVWRRSGSLSVESVVAYLIYAEYRIVVNVWDGQGMNSVHFVNFGTMVQSVGLLEMYSRIHSGLFDKFEHGLIYDFDLGSEFDYKYHRLEIFKSIDGLLKSVSVEATNLKPFGEIRINSRLVYKPDGGDKVYTIVLYGNKDGPTLLRLCDKFVPQGFKFFKFRGSFFREIGREEHEDIYYDQSFISVTEMEREEYSEAAGTSFDILEGSNALEMRSGDNPKLVLKRSNYFTVPTIEYRFEKLERLCEGQAQILSQSLANVKVYLFRGKRSFEFIEVVSDSAVEGAGSVRSAGAAESFSRNLNLYFVKEGASWVQVRQELFFDKFKEFVASSLKPEYSRLFFESVVKMKLLKHIDSFSSRFETDEVDFTYTRVLSGVERDVSKGLGETSSPCASASSEASDKLKDRGANVDKLKGGFYTCCVSSVASLFIAFVTSL